MHLCILGGPYAWIGFVDCGLSLKNFIIDFSSFVDRSLVVLEERKLSEEWVSL